MKKFYKPALLSALITLASIANAQQEQQAQTFTLEQCIDYALKNAINVQNSLIDEKIANSKVNETRGIILPQISGGVNAVTNPTLPRFFSRYSVAQGFSGTNSVTGQPNLQIAGLGPNDVVASQNFFQLQNSLNASVSINQLIFSGSYFVGLNAASAYKDYAEKSTNVTREQVIQNVTKAYYVVLINDERIQLFKNNISRVDSLLKNTTAQNMNGFAERIDVDRVQVNLNNLVTEKEKFERLQLLALELLKWQMNYPLNQPLKVVGEISDPSIDPNLLDNYLKDWNYKNRADYQALEVSKKLQDLNIRNKYASALPVLSASANLGYSKQSATFQKLFSNGKSFPETSTGTGPDKMYPFSSIGLNLSVPIFSGFQRSYQLQQEKLKAQKIDNSFRSLNAAIDIEIKQAATNYQNSVQTLESQKKNMGLAENIARVTKIKYQQGVGSNLEVVDAEGSLKEAQVNYYNALYDALVAKTDLDKAFGKLLPSSQNKN